MDISRRGFLQALALVATPALGVAQTPPYYVLNRFYVAGLQYYHGPQLLALMRPGDRLALEAEPDNVHDHYAVRIRGYGHMLGYVPRTDNRHISRLLRQGAPVCCAVSAVHSGAESWRAVRVEVGMG